MDKTEHLKPVNDHHLLISAQKNFEELKERFFELYILYALSKNLNFFLQTEDLFSKTINLLKDLLKIEDFCFMLIDENYDELKIWKASNDTYESAKDVTFKIGEGISGIVVQIGEPILVSDVSKEERFLYYKGRIRDIGSFLSVPLKLSDGKVMGVLNIQKREINGFKEQDKALFSAIANSIAHTIERARRYEKAQREAMYDDLTALYTRRYFLESCYQEWNKTERHGNNFSIIVADIDYFKYFNDTYGHALGDEILKKVASTLKSNVRQGDVVSRYGGEEFGLLLPETDKEGAVVIAEKLRTMVRSELAKEVHVSRVRKVTITAGVATYPDDGKTVEELIATADKYLYLGKESGRDRVVNAPLDDMFWGRDEKRSCVRHKAALKIVKGKNHIQLIELKVNDENWKMCAIRDVSRNGFKGELDLLTDIDTDYMCRNYLCKVVMDSENGMPHIFSIRIAHAIKIHQNHHKRYVIGVEILDEQNGWERLFDLLRH